MKLPSNVRHVDGSPYLTVGTFSHLPAASLQTGVFIGTQRRRAEAEQDVAHMKIPK